MPTFRSVDLFSGVGGIGHALSCWGVEPLLYCDINPFAQAVLRARMADGRLHAAPVLPDVRDTEAILAAVGGRQVDVLVASSSCVGFSCAGGGRGLRHPETALFGETVALMRRLRPPLAFFENVSHVLSSDGGRDFGVIVDDLSEAGYDLAWTVLAASDVGALHVRKRWFALAVRREGDVGRELAKRMATATAELPAPYEWSRAAAPVELLPRPDAATLGAAGARAWTRRRNSRVAALGNSVVPDAVRAAFRHLVRVMGGDALGGLRPPAPRGLGGGAPHPQPPRMTRGRPRAWPTHGVCTCGGDGAALVVAAISHPCGGVPRPPPDKWVVLDPSLNGGFGGGAPNDVGTGGSRRFTSPQRRRYLATPRHGNVHACRTLRARCIRDLGTQLRFLVDARGPRDGVYSPEFAEWLMGFPVGWTAT